ncbi:MAG TPA: hypothetical protein VMT63_14055 [Bacteroidales bacterium]|nr:hypothetical protein [Bacteroidales bacterium]
MKKFLYWSLAIIITLGAAYYQRKTGPTYPKKIRVEANGRSYDLRLVRSLGLNERPEVRLAISDTTVRARLHFRHFPTNEEYTASDFSYKEYPVHSALMKKMTGSDIEKGLYAEVPKQPAAGKLEYWFEVTDSKGTSPYMKETPVVIRFKGDVPALILVPHILSMFLAMLFSTLAGLMTIGVFKSYRKYATWTLVLLIIGGVILGPVVQHYAFGKFWTGVPFGWDLTDNKTLIALLFWILAVYLNRKAERPVYVAIAAIALIIVFSIPHSLFGSQFNYTTGHVTQGIILPLLH